MNLSDRDIKLLDLLLDDYFGLWEVRDYFLQLSPGSDPDAAGIECRERIKAYFDEDLIEVFIGWMSKNDFQRVTGPQAAGLLLESRSWARPVAPCEVVAVLGTKKAEMLLMKSSS